MPLDAVALVLAAATFHVAWNALLKASGDPLRTSTRAIGLGTLVATPLALAAWLVAGRPGLPPAGWALAGASGLVEVVYFVLLSAAYRRGALSAVYPVARGSAACLAALVGIVLLGERLGPVGLAGVALLVTGALAVALPGASRAAFLPALATGAAIAGYTTVDRLGVRTGPTWLYAWGLWATCALGLVAWTRIAPQRARLETRAGSEAPAGVALARGGTWADLARPLAAGILMIGTYLLVLAALAIAPLAGVAPLREASSVLAAGWGVVRLGERDGAALRLGGAAAIAAGAILLAIGS